MKERPIGALGFVPFLKTHECTVTSKKPLVVRATSELGSAKVGHLLPGQVVTLLEVHTFEDMETVRNELKSLRKEIHGHGERLCLQEPFS